VNFEFASPESLAPNSPLTTRNLQLGLLAVVLLIAGACGAAPSKATVTPNAASGPRIVLPSGAVYRVELARTPDELAQGLMFRESLPEHTGMLFLFLDGGVHKFWMKNTMIPLDMVWMDPEGRVLFVSGETPPCRAEPCPTYGPDLPAASVLEMAGGLASLEKISVGSTIRFIDVK
jgi:uncharacterized membrane protein (UPF0127 family)